MKTKLLKRLRKDIRISKDKDGWYFYKIKMFDIIDFSYEWVNHGFFYGEDGLKRLLKEIHYVIKRRLKKYYKIKKICVFLKLI